MKAKLNLIICAISIFIFFGCSSNSTGKIMNGSEVYTIHLGTQGESDFQQYNGIKDKQPAGMDFRTLQWNPPQLGTVRFEHGQYGFSIPHVFSVMGTTIARAKQDGIQTLDLNAGLSTEAFISRDQAYQAYVNLMSIIKKSGWKKFFGFSEARIAPESNLALILATGNVADPYTILSRDEFNKVIDKSPSTLYFNFYADGIVAALTLKKTAQKDKLEQYMLRYSFEDIRYQQRNMIENAYEMTAPEFEQAYKKLLNESSVNRTRLERLDKNKGFKIDEGYQDPDVWSYVK